MTGDHPGPSYIVHNLLSEELKPELEPALVHFSAESETSGKSRVIEEVLKLERRSGRRVIVVGASSTASSVAARLAELQQVKTVEPQAPAPRGFGQFAFVREGGGPANRAQRREEQRLARRRAKQKAKTKRQP